MLTIENVLDDAELAAIKAHLDEHSAVFENGQNTAGWAAKTVKKNEQLAEEAAKVVTEKVRLALMANPVFKSYARPKSFVRMLVSRYTPGMEYGLHVDDALMGGVRTDLSFTLFLNAPSSYMGGALMLEEPSGNIEIKPEAGSVFLYSTRLLHRVEPLASGERLAVVGWVRSFIRSDEQREVLFDLDQAVAAGRAGSMAKDEMNRLLKIRSNLMRMWAND